LNLYIREFLAKSETGSAPSRSARGSQRGGNYVARIQVGYTKDSKPKYRYFKTTEELERYRKWKNGDKAAKKQDKKRHERVDKLSSKKKKEDKESAANSSNSPGHAVRGPKVYGTDRERDDTEVKKSLFIWRFDT